MVNKVTRVIEVTANVAIIALSIVLILVFIQRGSLFAPATAQRTPAPALAVGETLQVPGASWRSQGSTLTLALSSGCRFCNESAPFYRRLVSRARQLNLDVAALMPEDTATARRYLDERSLEVPTVHLLDATAKISAFPTLVLLGPGGVVRDVWVGKLNVSQEDAVIARLASIDSN